MRGGQTGGKIRVLLVDALAIVHQGLAGILNDPDTVIAETSNGEQAVQQTRLHRPDVIIMDVSSRA